MKKIKILLFVAGVLVLGACSKEDSIKKDAREFAELTCESIKLMGKAMAGDMDAQSRMDELSDRMERKSEELDKKYPSPEEKQKLGEMILTETGNCE